MTWYRRSRLYPPPLPSPLHLPLLGFCCVQAACDVLHIGTSLCFSWRARHTLITNPLFRYYFILVVTAPSGDLTAALYNIAQYTSSHFQVCRESNIKHLMTGHEGNKVNFFPEGLVLKWFVIAGNFEAGNSLNLANDGRRSTFAGIEQCTVTVIDFAKLPAQRFWRETLLLLDVIWLRSNQWERTLLRKNFQLYSNMTYN